LGKTRSICNEQGSVYFLFPYDEYDNETDYKSWTKGQTLVNKQDTAKKMESFAVGTLKFSPGIYILEINAKNKSGEEVKM
jgi:hypothetical protein